jgi:mannose/cellobiose epimerase-like protein (N-acyl-D-glucosamine 2-epimerase family)
MLLEHLRPYVGRLCATGTGAAFGDVHLAIARIEHLLGDHEAARRHVDASVTALTRANAVPWLVRALLLRAELTGDGADRDEAARLLQHRRLPLLERRVEASLRS